MCESLDMVSPRFSTLLCLTTVLAGSSAVRWDLLTSLGPRAAKWVEIRPWRGMERGVFARRRISAATPMWSVPRSRMICQSDVLSSQSGKLAAYLLQNERISRTFFDTDSPQSLGLTSVFAVRLLELFADPPAHLEEYLDSLPMVGDHPLVRPRGAASRCCSLHCRRPSQFWSYMDIERLHGSRARDAIRVMQSHMGQLLRLFSSAGALSHIFEPRGVPLRPSEFKCVPVRRRACTGSSLSSARLRRRAIVLVASRLFHVEFSGLDRVRLGPDSIALLRDGEVRPRYCGASPANAKAGGAHSHPCWASGQVVDMGSASEMQRQYPLEPCLIPL